MFALAAAIVAFLALIGVDAENLMWWWLLFIALHFAFGWGLPIPGPPWGRRTNGSQRP